MSDLRIAVLGVGVMGADHVARITNRISNARVVVVNDYLTEKAEQVAASVPGARVVGDPLDAIADPTTSTRSCSPRRARRTRSSCWPAWSTASRCCVRNR